MYKSKTYATILHCLSFPAPIGNPVGLLSGYPFSLTVGALSTGMTNKEINNLLKIYTNKRDDDLQRFMPESFIYASEQYRIDEAVPVLKRNESQAT
ncbi:MAG: hypothetical protein C4560_13355 [Nitrospiraceae bacterium]|nr:MAG: hypothetical protein C4560_13355 [Nitrospiraceae bacterium]